RLTCSQIVVAGVYKYLGGPVRKYDAAGVIGHIRQLASSKPALDNVISRKAVFQIIPHADGRTPGKYDAAFQRKILPVLLLERSDLVFKTAFVVLGLQKRPHTNKNKCNN